MDLLNETAIEIRQLTKGIFVGSKSIFRCKIESNSISISLNFHQGCCIMTAKLKEFQLEKLRDLAKLPDGKASMYTEACVWCMDQHGHEVGVVLDLLFDKKNYSHTVHWLESNIDVEKIRAHYNSDDAVSFGAEAIAMFICIAHTDYDHIQRSMKKTGIDYWLSHKNANPNLPFQNSGRLEISGILRENDKNTVDQRVKEKIRQSTQSENTTLPVYVVVVAFDRPYAKMVVKNVDS